MTCLHPIKAWVPIKADLYTPAQQYFKDKKTSFKEKPNTQQIELPCGHCLGCRLDHADMWSTRIMLEAKQWKNCCVIALTYNDTHVHVNSNNLYSLKKRDLQLFLKKLRKKHTGIETWIHPIKQIEEKPIRYFACGEYGMTGTRATAGGNPHFHIILFNYKPEDLQFWKFNKYGDPIYKSKEIQKIWGNGFITVEDLNYNTACYVARYVQKKAGIQAIKRKYEDEETPTEYREKIDERTGEILDMPVNHIVKHEHFQEPEFITMSRGVGIGVNYWINNKKTVKQNKGIMLKIDGKVKIKPIPRYYKKLWEKEDYIEYYRFKYEKQKDGIKKKAEILAQISLPDGTTEEVKWSFYLKQTEKSLYQKVPKRNNFIE